MQQHRPLQTHTLRRATIESNELSKPSANKNLTCATKVTLGIAGLRMREKEREMKEGRKSRSVTKEAGSDQKPTNTRQAQNR